MPVQAGSSFYTAELAQIGLSDGVRGQPFSEPYKTDAAMLLS